MNRTIMKRGMTVIAASAVAAAVLVGCGRSGDASGGGTADGPVPTNNCPASALTPLKKGDPIKLGTSLAQSGPIAIVANVGKGAGAVYAEASASGGVDGHKIEFTIRDDAFETGRAVTNVRQLIDSDQVMALASQIGTPLIAATQPFVEKSCTPQLWGATGVSALAASPTVHPWTTTGLLPYESEGALWVKALAQTKPNGGNIVLITADNDSAAAYESSVKKAAAGTNFTLAGVEQVAAAAPNVDAQVNATMARKPDAVLVGTNANACPPLMTGLRRAGFKGSIIVNANCAGIGANFVPAGAAADGVMVLTSTADPGNPAEKGSPDLDKYKSVMAKYAPDADAGSLYTAIGYQQGYLTLKVLEKAASLKGGLNRANIMNAAWTINTTVPLSPEGAKAHLDWTTQPVWRTEVVLRRYEQGKGLVPVGGTISLLN